MAKTVLVVDDSPTIRGIVCAAIEDQLGWNVVECGDGVEALRELPSQAIDLIITDINMPQLNGLELLKYVRGNELYKNVPVIIVTTEGQVRDRQKGIALGAAGYLVKPFEPMKLVELCKSSVGD